MQFVRGASRLTTANGNLCPSMRPAEKLSTDQNCAARSRPNRGPMRVYSAVHVELGLIRCAKNCKSSGAKVYDLRNSQWGLLCGLFYHPAGVTSRSPTG